MRGSEATEPERAERARGEGLGGGCPPSHGESFWNFHGVNRAIWCMFLACFIDLKQPF